MGFMNTTLIKLLKLLWIFDEGGRHDEKNLVFILMSRINPFENLKINILRLLFKLNARLIICGIL